MIIECSGSEGKPACKSQNAG